MKPQVITDTECLKGFWMVRFMRRDSRQRLVYELYDGHPLDRARILRVMRDYEVMGFNLNPYDAPMIAMALAGFDNDALYDASNIIIGSRMMPWDAEKHFGFKIPEEWTLVDMIEPAPGVMVSLKLYGARMFAPSIQDMPLEHSDVVDTPGKRAMVVKYNDNDIDTTELMAQFLDEPLTLRRSMSERYGIDLMSKSDAQVAENIMKSELKKRGVWPSRPEIPAGTRFNYTAPSFIQFMSEELRTLVKEIESQDFVVNDNGSPVAPPCLENRVVTIKGRAFKMGMGGLHSQEKTVTYRATDDMAIVDRDVTSFYPYIILLCRLFPKHLGEDFLIIYQAIVMDRVDAKTKMQALEAAGRKGDPLWEQMKVVAESLKIAANGLFGKLGSVWSSVFAPDLLIQVTVTGQLLLLMLIEAIGHSECVVVSANTDGIVTLVPKEYEGNFARAIKRWEDATGFKTEETRYKYLASRDVNNYIAGKLKGGSKGKGAYTNPWANNDLRGQLMKSPHMIVCLDAVQAFLESGKPVYETIIECTDIRKFSTARTVNGGAVFRGEFLGRVARWYWSSVSKDVIRYRALNKATKKKIAEGIEMPGAVGNTVPDSDGAEVIMDLPKQLPRDIHYDRYIRYSIDMLKDIGAI